jgi:hypothetical protein
VNNGGESFYTKSSPLDFHLSSSMESLDLTHSEKRKAEY